MAQHESLAGDMLHFATIAIEYFEIRDPIDDWNKKGLTPRETALKAGNSIGAEYLISMENRVKKLRANDFQPDFNPQDDQMRLSPYIEADKKAILGSIVLAHGVADLISGASLSSFVIFAFGASEIFLGGTICHEAFQVWKHKIKNRP